MKSKIALFVNQNVIHLNGSRTQAHDGASWTDQRTGRHPAIQSFREQERVALLLLLRVSLLWPPPRRRSEREKDHNLTIS